MYIDLLYSHKEYYEDEILRLLEKSINDNWGICKKGMCNALTTQWNEVLKQEKGKTKAYR